MNLEEKSKLKLIFIDIINGFSKERLNNQDIYLKHLNIYDSGDVESIKDFFYKKALKEGLPSESEKLKYLYDEKLWHKKDEDEILNIQNYINNLRNTKKKLFKSKDVQALNTQIEHEEQRLSKIKSDRKKLIGFTAEDYSIKRSNEHIIFISLYKDPNLKDKLFSDLDFRNAEEEELSKLGEMYFKNSNEFSSSNLKKIALLPFYKNLYHLCSDNPYYLYGKKVLDLSFYQIEIFSYARYFSNIISQSKTPPPDEYFEDPDKLIDWVDSSKNADEILNNKKQGDADGKSLVGATKEDLKKAGLDESNGISIFEEAKKRGGALSMEDMMRLHGIK